MKYPFLLAGALLLSAPVFAQVHPLTAQAVVEPSGYELLVEAGKLISRKSTGVPSPFRVSPAQELQNKREAVARNASALALLRRALQKPIEFPPLKTINDSIGNVGNDSRELARQLVQESDVRFGDGDTVGAMQSRLDIFDLATRFEHAALIEALVASAIASIGRKDFAKVAAKLNGAQCREAATRLKAMERRQAAFADILTHEELQTQQELLNALPVIQKENLTPEGREGNQMNEEEATQVAALTPAQLRDDINSVFAPVLRNARRPYARQETVKTAPEVNPLLQGTPGILSLPQTRFRFERGHAQDRLLLAALELRAQKLEKGIYPDFFQSLPDPFSPDAHPLRYAKTAGGYLLYSLGPDGKNDEGTGFQMYTVDASIPTNAPAPSDFGVGNWGRNQKPTGPTSVEHLPPDFQGDIVQSPF